MRGIFQKYRMAFAVLVMMASGLLSPTPAAWAQADRIVSVNIAAGRLSTALGELGQQANVSIVGSSPELAQLNTPAVRGQFTASQVLRRLLRGTAFIARQINNRTFRIERRSAEQNPAPSRLSRLPTVPSAKPVPSPLPIIVSATKRDVSLLEYPGGVNRVELDDFSSGQLGEGLEGVLTRMPVTNSTALGSGRNKLFIRGIADSSFNGPTQSTIGMYLGEQRLLYSASNPDLRLYDMEAIEILEGPQGTLYGAGAIGGVIRMVPAAPDFEEVKSSIWGSAMITKGGDPGYDLGAMFNLPTANGQAMRGVIYKGQAGGYIDDNRRNIEDVNQGRVEGGRLALRTEFSPAWSLNLSGFAQMSEARDGQYINARLPGVTQRSRFGQRFESDIYGLNLLVNGGVGNIDILSSTGIVRHNLNTRYDATVLDGPGGGDLYDERRQILLFDHETRLSGKIANRFSWLAGGSLLIHEDDIEQLFVNLDGLDPPPFVNILYDVREYALFGEASYELFDGATVTTGGRLAHTQGRTRRNFGAAPPVQPRVDETRFLPVAGLSLKMSTDVTGYLRYQHGFRTGGVTVERSNNGAPQIARFVSDRVRSLEAGLKGQLYQNSPIEFKLAGFYLRWKDIQADLIEPEGFTITRNIGDAEIFGLTFQSTTALTADLELRNSLFLNHSKIMRLTPNQGAISSMLPNIAPYGAHLELQYRHTLPNESALIGLAGLRYQGRSVLDIGPTEQVRQGNFASADLSVVWRHPRWEVGLEALNITNTRGNRFSFGNPFTLRREQQETPLRPFSVRFSAKINF